MGAEWKLSSRLSLIDAGPCGSAVVQKDGRPLFKAWGAACREGVFGKIGTVVRVE